MGHFSEYVRKYLILDNRQKNFPSEICSRHINRGFIDNARNIGLPAIKQKNDARMAAEH